MHLIKIFVVCSFIGFSFSVSAVNDQQELLNFFQGQYDLIGVQPDSNVTYRGVATFKVKQNYLEVTRTINDSTVHAIAKIEQVEMAETIVLRIRFIENNTELEETCLFQADLDNYARLSCYLYSPGSKTDRPGMEAYFIKQN